MVKACAEDSKSFESIARILVDHYSGVHLREGKSLGGSSRLLAQDTATPERVADPRGNLKDSPVAPVEEGNEDDEDSWREDSWDGYQLEAYPAASYDDDEDDPEMLPDEEQGYEDFELEEPEAIALNSIEGLDDTADAGHAVQLQLAANAAFGKAIVVSSPIPGKLAGLPLEIHVKSMMPRVPAGRLRKAALIWLRHSATLPVCSV